MQFQCGMDMHVALYHRVALGDIPKPPTSVHWLLQLISYFDYLHCTTHIHHHHYTR